MVLKELIFNSFYFFTGDSSSGLICNSFYFGWVVLKELIFNRFLCWEGVVVLKEWTFKCLYIGRVWWS